MKFWQCPECGRVRYYREPQEEFICIVCNIPMELLDKRKGTVIGNG